MLFTNSIHRKMMFGLALVAVMLAASSISAWLSLRWYYDAARDLDFSVNAMPRRADLDAAIGALFEPLLWEGVPPQVQDREFGKRLEKVRGTVSRFRRQLDALPPTDGALAQRPIIDAKLNKVAGHLAAMGEHRSQLADPQSQQATAWILKHMVAATLTEVQQIPDPQQGLSATIRHAIAGYDKRVRWIIGSGAVVGILFLWLWRYGHTSIFTPLRQLHRGARRVAQGDFDYRIRLKRVANGDEMAELAEAFNQMTGRFQEITCDLDRQVQERSRQLVRSERLAGIGFLAAGVAHEINNPLSAIAMAAESLESRSDELFAGLAEADAKLVTQYLGMIQRESFRCQQITRRLLDFARGRDDERTRFDLAQTIREVLEMVRHMGKYQKRHVAFAAIGPVHLEGNAPEIKQVVLNLVANALEATEDGGRLAIAVEERTDAVLVTFRDDGCGMTPDVAEHLFEPFFTKRKGGKGTGLGLSISHRIVADHGGTIEAISDGPGKGSTFRVRLPRRSAAKLAA